MIEILSKELIITKTLNVTDKKFVYVSIDDDIKIGIVENSEISMKVEMSIFKKSHLISNREYALFDTKLEDLYAHYKTILENYEFNVQELLKSNYLNDYVAKKIVSKTVKRVVDILNKEFKNFDTFVFDFAKLKHQNKLIKLIDESFKMRKLYYL